MTGKQIEYILAIEKFRSISRAAESLGISQPYLSQFLSNLESNLGYTLFDRSAFPITITPYGEAFVETAKEINNLEIDLAKRLNELNNSFTGKISVVIPSHASFGIMPGVLKAFHRSYPKYKVNVITDSVNDYIEAIKTGYADLAITAREFEDASIGAITTRAAALLVAAPESFDLADENADSTDDLYPMVSLKKLANVPFIQVKSDGGLIRERVSEIMGDYSIDNNTIIDCDSYFLCIELIQEGLGASIIPSTCINHYTVPEKVKYYSIPSKTKPKDINIYYRKKAYISKAMEDFINLIIQTLQTTV